MRSRNIILALFLGAVVFGAYKNRYQPKYVYIPNDISVTIPEGKNIAEIEEIILAAGIKLQNRLLTRENLALEGQLFPDTYRFDKESSAEDIIARMKKDLPDRPTLVIASMLEKEVRTEEDMKIVAGIIQKRLAAGMALQIDATVAYGVCLPIWQNGGPCDASQVNLVDNIKKDSAYNTYARVGLPAGPVSNPGAKALNAALNPQASDYWYYLSAKEDGRTIFSRTLEEHNAARRKYR